MGLISNDDREHLKNEFAQLTNSVRLVMFTQDHECQYCRETREIVNELSELSDKINVDVYDFVADEEEAVALGVDKIPAIAILKDGAEPVDYGIRYYGIPSGYEFSSLIEDITMVGRGDSGLENETRTALASLPAPVHMQVFVTPTCPYCPRAVHLAHQMAFESNKVRADMVEAMEFPHLSNKYDVMGVPRTVINEDTHVEGAAPEHMLLHEVLGALGLEHQH